ncbi:MAG: helix-turn-helix domain-containing protein [Longimicrobiales bacterium]
MDPPAIRIDIPALPLCHLRLSARKPEDPTVSKNPRTWGEHLRRQRILRGLLQTEVADAIGVSVETIIHWEWHRTTPPARIIPRITLFLGYCPWTAPETRGERLRQVRVGLGLSQKAAARLLSVDPATVTRWELDERRLSRGSEPGRLLLALVTECGTDRSSPMNDGAS